MQIQQLRKLISQTLTKTKVLKLTEIVKRKNFNIKNLIDLNLMRTSKLVFVLPGF